MINRPRTAFVSVAAVAVSMIVLGSDARAKSVPAASPQKYVRFLQQLAKGEMKNGTSLMQRASSLERTMNRLKNIPNPGPRLARRIATQEKTVSSKSRWSLLDPEKHQRPSSDTGGPQALPPADLTPRQQAQVSSLLSSIQAQVVSERGVATPTR